MGKKMFWSTTVLLAVFIFTSGVCMVDAPTVLSVEPTSETTFNITISNVVDLFGYDLKITWNSGILTLQEVTILQVWTNSFVAINRTDAGSYRLVTLSTDETFTGTTVLFTLTFTPIKFGETDINFTIAKLSDKCWNYLTAELEPYSYSKVSTASDIPEASTYFGMANTLYDINGDGIVDVFDLRILGAEPPK